MKLEQLLEIILKYPLAHCSLYLATEANQYKRFLLKIIFDLIQRVVKKCAGQCLQKWPKFFGGTITQKYWVSSTFDHSLPIRVCHFQKNPKFWKILIFPLPRAIDTKRKMLEM